MPPWRRSIDWPARIRMHTLRRRLGTVSIIHIAIWVPRRWPLGGSRLHDPYIRDGWTQTMATTPSYVLTPLPTPNRQRTSRSLWDRDCRTTLLTKEAWHLSC